MSSQPARRIFINHRPHLIDRMALTGSDIAALAGVPRDNVVVEIETPAGLREVALDETLTTADGSSFLVTRQFIMGGMA